MYPNPSIAKTGLSFLKNINITGILDGTQKTLGIINQAIPIVYQVKPIVNNLGTIFKISNILNDKEENHSEKEKNLPEQKNSPIFYI